ADHRSVTDVLHDGLGVGSVDGAGIDDRYRAAGVEDPRVGAGTGEDPRVGGQHSFDSHGRLAASGRVIRTIEPSSSTTGSIGRMVVWRAAAWTESTPPWRASHSR